MLKSTGMVRSLDNLGRVVIPMEIRKTLDIVTGEVEFYVDGEKIVLKKYAPGCLYCGTAEKLVTYNGKNICRSCVNEISKFNEVMEREGV